ncbi:MAG: DUF5658 family protein [Armatimonadota bacterium]
MQSAARGRYAAARPRVWSAAAAPGLPVCAEAMVLFAICALDMLSSAWLFHHGLATEANPLLRPAAEAGLLPFMLAKSASFIPALVILEALRRRHQQFVVRLLRIAIVAYVGIYGTLTLGQML